MRYGLLILFIGFSSILAQADVLLRVRPHVVVAPETEVTLAQLIDGHALSAETRQKLESIRISRAPALGEKQELASASLMESLREVVERERAQSHAQVHVVLPKQVIIDTMKREMTDEQVAQELTQAWQPLCADCKLSVEALSLPRVENVRDWSLKIKGELPHGSFSIPVDLTRENGKLLGAFVSGRLITKRKVPVAARMMSIGQRLQAEDFTVEYKDVSYAYDGIPAVEGLVGLHLKQGVRAGDILFASLVEKDKAIHRGELVSVHSGTSQWDVSVNMVAQQDAAIGEVVSLKNPKTNDTLMGEVTGLGEVELR